MTRSRIQKNRRIFRRNATAYLQTSGISMKR